MTPDQIVERARSCLGKGVTYGLGKGGMHPDAAHPWVGEVIEHVAVNLLDCSGFALWCCGMSRYQPPLWWDTTRCWGDAKGPKSLFEAFPWELAKPGDLLVYPDHNGKQGHVGVVTVAGSEGPSLMIDCSSSSSRNHQDAIMEREPSPFVLRPDTLVARLKVAEGTG